MRLPIVSLLLTVGCGGTEPVTPDPVPPVETEVKAGELPLAIPAGSEALAVVGPRVDVNAASAAELKKIPGMTDKMVHEFEEYRPYVSISQFRKEMGKYVDAERIAAYEKHIYVPIDPNKSDAATLQQLPGLDAGEAEKLMGLRPFADQAAFIAAVSPLLDPAGAAVVEQWLAK